MSYRLKIFAKSESGSWICTDSATIENNTCLDIDADNDLSIRYPGRIYLISHSKIYGRTDRKYVFYNGSRILHKLEIDFSKIQPWNPFDAYDNIENVKAEYIAKYKPEFERMLEQVKIQIEQDNVKKLLDNI